MEESGLRGLRVLSFESRRSAEMAELIRRHGGEPVSAPALREVPLEGSRELLDYVARVERGEIDVIVLMTGVGLRTLVSAVAGEYPAERLAAILKRADLVARGPKPVAALRELGLTPTVTVPEPNTWREILATLDDRLPVTGKRVAVQEYGVGNPEFLEGLEARGARVSRVEIYRWALPDDVEPLRQGVEALASANVDVALFTSATQVHHLFQVAGERAEAVRRGCERVVIASIGPVCSEALSTNGIAVDLEPEHGKMGQLVAAVAKRGRALLTAKRGDSVHNPS